MGKLRVYCLKTLKKPSIYPLGKTPSAPSVTHVVTNNSTTEGSTLVWIQTMMCQFAVRHLTDGMNKVAMIKIFESVLVRIMGVGTMIKVMGRRIFDPVFITSILWKCQTRVTTKTRDLLGIPPHYT